MRLTKEAKRQIIDERDQVFEKMSNCEDPEKWKFYKEQYDGYNDMLKRTWKVSPDTLLLVGANILGLILILNYEKMGIVTSKALNFVLRGRV